MANRWGRILKGMFTHSNNHRKTASDDGDAIDLACGTPRAGQ